MKDFDGPGVDDRFRRLLAKANPIRWGFFHHLKTSTYYRGRVVILGDSAHASLPFQAAGAAQGLEDAVVLSSVLAKIVKDPRADTTSQVRLHAAMNAYDSIRRPRAQKQLEQSAEVSSMIFLEHEKAGDDVTKILPILQQGRFEWLWFHDLRHDVNTALSSLQTEALVPSTLQACS